MSIVSNGRDGRVNLQATLAATSATGIWDPEVQPHHPITCGSELHYHEDGSLCCAHSSAGRAGLNAWSTDAILCRRLLALSPVIS